MLDIYLVTFADKKYAKTLERIKLEALNMNVFKEVFAWNEDDLDEEWRHAHNEFIENHRRGYGYWIWKPQVIRQALDRVPKGKSVVVYCDAGCTLNAKARKMLIDLCYFAKYESTAGVLALEMHYIESHWTKMDLFHFMNYKDFHSKQVQAGVSFWANVDNARNLVNEWCHICCVENYRYVDDSPSKTKNLSTFKEHRHDQSIFSILMKTRKGRLIPRWPNSVEFPIHTSRLKF